MPHTLALQIALAGASGLLHPLLFPSFDLGFLAWVFLIPLHLAVSRSAPRRAFWLGWLCGTIGFVGTMYWVVTAMHLYGRMPFAVSAALMLLLSAYLGLYVALYALLVAWCRPRLGAWLLLAAPCAWVTLELIRTYLFSGLPWSLLGYSQYAYLPVIQIAEVTGVYGVSFVIVLVNVGLAETGLRALAQWRDSAPAGPPASGPVPWMPPLLAAALAVAVTMGYGLLRLASLEQPGPTAIAGMERTLRIGLVQANIDQAHKWDPAYRRETLQRYEALTNLAAEGTDLVIWPEAATPFLFERELDYRVHVTRLVQSRSVPLLLGSPAVGYEADGQPYLLNSAYLLARTGQIIGRYDKQHLVPFGEYIPLKSSLLFFLDKLVEGIGDFKPGRGPTLLQLPQPASEAPARFGVVICYEVIFPDLVRRFAAAGADFMTTITNDAWFGDSVAPHQHFGMVVLRAVENRIAFARAANTGVSGLIDPLGRILSATPVFEQAALKGAIPVGRVPTFYTRFGDVFAYACAIIAALLLAVARRRQGTGSGVRG